MPVWQLYWNRTELEISGTYWRILQELYHRLPVFAWNHVNFRGTWLLKNISGLNYDEASRCIWQCTSFWNFSRIKHWFQIFYVSCQISFEEFHRHFYHNYHSEIYDHLQKFLGKCVRNFIKKSPLSCHLSSNCTINSCCCWSEPTECGR